MKKILVSGGIYVFLTNEEYHLLKNTSEKIIDRSNLSDRQKIIASKLHSKGVFSCEKKENNTYYRLNQNGFI